MPNLFRIMVGGNAPRSAATSHVGPTTSTSGGNSGTGNPSTTTSSTAAMGNPFQATEAASPSNAATASNAASRSRYTYPGHRANPSTTTSSPSSTAVSGMPATPLDFMTTTNNFAASLPSAPPRTGAFDANYYSSGAASQPAHQQQYQPSNMVTSSAPPASRFPSVNNYHSTMTASAPAATMAPYNPFSTALDLGGSNQHANSMLPPPDSSSLNGMLVGEMRSSSTPPDPPATASAPSGEAALISSSMTQSAPNASLNATATTTTSRPGAFQVTRTSSGPAQVYRVTVPAGVRPGAEFTVHAGPRRVRVRCPPTSRAGQSLQITLPPEPVVQHVPLKMAPITAATGFAPGGGAVPMSADVFRVNQEAADSGGTAQTFLVTIPPNVYPGMQFTVNLAGQRFLVTCPANAGPNQKVRIVPPIKPAAPTMDDGAPEAAPKTQVFEVAVPSGVQPGQPFALVANGQRVLVTCPPNVVPGQKIRFQLPVSQVVGNIALQYESAAASGWRRTVRVTDLKFQWVRIDESAKNNIAKSKAQDLNSKKAGLGDSGDGFLPKEDPPGSTSSPLIEDDPASMGGATATSSAGQIVDVDGMERFDFRRSAYVRKLTYMEGNDARMRTGKVELIPANDAVVDSRLVVHNHTLLSYADIAAVQGKPLEDKTEWFQRICSQLTAAWEDGHIKIVVRRKHLLLDSVDAVMSLGREDMRKRWRIEFFGEPGIDAGGVAREWFTLVTEQIFDPDFGLWLSSLNNQMCMTVNPSSAMSCPEDHLIYFRFLGRVLGRALFDRQLVKGHMVRSLYKHMLGWPITFEDIQAEDEEYYQSLKKLTKLEDVSMMCLDFTVTEESMGVRKEIDLMPGGAMKEVTNENLAQYLEANLRYRMLERIKPQLTELLLGFFDVVPEPALTVFDANELELILCGLPEIDIDDWQRHTNYSGLCEGKGKKDKVIQWFWEIVVEEFDQEMRARLLQFVTGTSGVPSRGFSVLQGVDGNIKKFTIHGVDTRQFVYPRAHTCFNRMDLPNYKTKEELRDRLKTAITLAGVGFDIE